MPPNQGKPFFKNAEDAAAKTLADDFSAHGYNIGDGIEEVLKIDRCTGIHLEAGISQAETEIKP
jgi:hypothetical protein